MPTTLDRNTLNPERLQEIKALGDLPSPKGAALAVMRLCQKPDVSVAELAHVVQTDPALVGRLVKAANSLHGKSRPVAAVQDALILLGISTARYLALSFSLVSNFQSGQCGKFDYSRFWSHSLACAVAMRQDWGLPRMFVEAANWRSRAMTWSRWAIGSLASGGNGPPC